MPARPLIGVTLYGPKSVKFIMEFKRGVRVLMVKHADWKSDVTSVRPRLQTLYDGSTDLEYIIDFDELQRDLTDEQNGVDLQYTGTSVLGRFLRPLGEAV